MDKRIFKDNIYTAIAGISKAFSNPNRLEIIDLLANGEKSVEQIAAQTAITVANASQHLQVLKNARLVSTRRDGNFIYYGLNGHLVFAAWKAVRDLAIEQEPYIQVTLQQFRKELGSDASRSYKTMPVNDNVLFLDVRPADEFDAGHVSTALSIPMSELAQRWTELPRDKTIITYCRGPFCTYADEAVQLLKANGFTAIRMEEGYLDVQLLNESLS